MKMRNDVCRFYRPSLDSDKCQKGHDVDQMLNNSFNEGPIWNRIPCWDRSGISCKDKEKWTRAEIEEYERNVDELLNSADKCKNAIMKYIEGMEFKSTQDLQDWILCPICGSGKLYFSYSGYNGHVHAQCDAECISFQE